MAEVKSAGIIFICFTLLHGFTAALNCTSPTPASLFNELGKNLFSNNLVPPVGSFSHPMNVTISITVVGILGVDEKTQTLTTVLWQVLEWDIEGLSWDVQQCGATRVSVLREKLWVPDIHIAELCELDKKALKVKIFSQSQTCKLDKGKSLCSMGEDESPRTPYVYLNNTGRVYDDKPIKVVSSCQLGIYTFPFDVQNCSLTFGSYLHFATDIVMIQGSTAEEILEESRDVLQTNGEWELADIRVVDSTLSLEDGSYSEIKYFLILRRRPILYVVNLLIPSCFLITVDLFSFLLPPQSVDRSSFKMTLILGYTVFLLIMNDLLPATGEKTPLISVFFSLSLALMVASLLETAFITNIQFSSSQYSAVPNWLSILVLRYLAVVVCLPPKEKSNRVTVFLNPSTKAEPAKSTSSTDISGSQSISNDAAKPPQSPPHPPDPPPPADPTLDELRRLSRDLAAVRHQMDTYFQGTKASQEWQRIGIVVDRLLFGLYIVFIVISFITIISIWIWNNSYAA